MHHLVSEVKDGKILIQIPQDFYEKKAVSAAADKLSDLFSVNTERLDEKTVGVYFRPKQGLTMEEKELTDAAFYLCREIARKRARLEA